METVETVPTRPGDSIPHPRGAPVAFEDGPAPPPAVSRPALPEEGSFPPPSELRRRGSGFGCVAAAAVAAAAGLVLVAGGVSAVRDAMALPQPARAAALALEGAFALVLVWSLARLALALRALPAFPQVSAEEARVPRRLAARLRAHVRSLGAPEKWAAACGFAPGDPAPALLRRLAEARHLDRDAWLQDWAEFSGLVDARAREIAARRAKLVAVKTAASPWRAVDGLAVSWHSTAMTAELAVLHGRRMSRRDAFRYAARAAFSLWVAGTAGDVAEAASERLPELFDGENFPAWAARALPFGGKLLGKTAEGAANAWLVWRLGRRAAAAFRPVAARES